MKINSNSDLINLKLPSKINLTN